MMLRQWSHSFIHVFLTIFSFVSLIQGCAEDDAQYLERERSLVDVNAAHSLESQSSDETEDVSFDDSEGALQPGMISGSYLVQCDHHAPTGGVACKFLEEDTNTPITDLSSYSFALLDSKGKDVGSRAKFIFSPDGGYSFFIEFQESLVDWRLSITKKAQDGRPGYSEGIVVPLKEQVYFLSESQIIINSGNPISDRNNVPVKVSDSQAKKIGYSKTSCEALRWVNLSASHEASVSLLSEGEDKGFLYIVVESETGGHSHCFLKFLEFESATLPAPELLSFSINRKAGSDYDIQATWAHGEQFGRSGYIVYVGSKPGLDNILGQQSLGGAEPSLVRTLQLTPGHKYYLHVHSVDSIGGSSPPAERVFEASVEANDISGLLLWLDAGALSASMPLSQWSDKGPHAYHFSPNDQTQAPSLRPFGGKVGAHFEGSKASPMKAFLRNDRIDIRQSVRPKITSVAVFQKHAHTFPEVPTIWASVQNGDTKRAHSMGAAPEDKTVVEILEFSYNPSNERTQVKKWRNGVLIVDKSEALEQGAQTFSGLGIGCDRYASHNGGTEYCGHFTLGEVILYERSLDEAERELLTLNLSRKWGVAQDP